MGSSPGVCSTALATSSAVSSSAVSLSAGASMSVSTERISARAIGTAAVECGRVMRQEGVAVRRRARGFRSGTSAGVLGSDGSALKTSCSHLTKPGDADKSLPPGTKGTFVTEAAPGPLYRVLVTAVTQR